MLRRIWIITSWTAGIAAYASLMAFAQHEAAHVALKNIDIRIEQQQNQYFINKEDVLALLVKIDDSLPNRTRQAINTNLLEESLRQNPYIAGAEVFSTLDGTLSVIVKQKTAVARVIATPQHFYLDAEGHSYPTTQNHSAYVPVITGHLDSARIYQAYSVIAAINENPYFTNWLAEAHVTPAGNIELVPNTGNHRVLFGRYTQAKNKLLRLQAFYTQVATPQNLAQWRTINVAYQNQLVTTKYPL